VTTVEPTMTTWLHTPGMPKYVPDFSAAAELTDPAKALANKWKSEDAAVRAEAGAVDISTLHVYSQMYVGLLAWLCFGFGRGVWFEPR